MLHPPARRRTRRAAAALVLAAGIGLVAGCSSDDTTDTAGADATAADTAAAPSTTAETGTSSGAPSSSAAGSPAESEAVSVTEGEMFIQLSEDSFGAGTYTFEVTNTGTMPHDFVVEQGGSDVAGTEVIQPGQSTTLEVELAPGEYVFYCSVGAHRAAGMEVPVTVAA